MDVVKTTTQATISEIKSASTMLTESSTQMATMTTLYCDVLKSMTTSHVAMVPSLDSRVCMREGMKARQVLVDTLTPDQQLHWLANNAQLVMMANEALHSMEHPPTHQFMGVRLLNNGRLRLEMDSEAAASWLSQPDNRADFLGQVTLDTALKPHTYSLVVQFVPHQFRPDDEARLHDIKEANMLPRNTILHAHRIKLAYCRASDQMCRHILVVMTRPKDANSVLTNGIIICQKRVYTEKCKKEPTRCLKCHGWGHMSYDCQQPFNTWWMCVGHHRTTTCDNQDRPWCVSCRAKGHTSWSH